MGALSGALFFLVLICCFFGWAFWVVLGAILGSKLFSSYFSVALASHTLFSLLFSYYLDVFNRLRALGYPFLGKVPKIR